MLERCTGHAADLERTRLGVEKLELPGIGCSFQLWHRMKALPGWKTEPVAVVRGAAVLKWNVEDHLVAVGIPRCCDVHCSARTTDTGVEHIHMLGVP